MRIIAKWAMVGQVEDYNNGKSPYGLYNGTSCSVQSTVNKVYISTGSSLKDTFQFYIVGIWINKKTERVTPNIALPIVWSSRYVRRMGAYQLLNGNLKSQSRNRLEDCY